MKYYKFALVTLFISLFWSCEPAVVFSEPQPKGVDALTSIPEQFQGTFWCEMDSVSLVVNKSSIYKSKLVDVELNLSDINDSKEIRFENGQLIFDSSKQSFPATEKKGIVLSTLNLKDTLYVTQKSEHVLKLFKGHLVLNNQIRDKHWEVKLLTLRPTGSIAISQVDYPENLTDLQTITTVKTLDSRAREQILISPTKAEFDQILDKNLIFTGACQEFRPIVPFKNNMP